MEGELFSGNCFSVHSLIMPQTFIKRALSAEAHSGCWALAVTGKPGPLISCTWLGCVGGGIGH